MFCQNCGTRVGEGDQFCINCGAALTAHEQPAASNEFSVDPACYNMPLGGYSMQTNMTRETAGVSIPEEVRGLPKLIFTFGLISFISSICWLLIPFFVSLVSEWNFSVLVFSVNFVLIALIFGCIARNKALDLEYEYDVPLVGQLRVGRNFATAGRTIAIVEIPIATVAMIVGFLTSVV